MQILVSPEACVNGIKTNFNELIITATILYKFPLVRLCNSNIESLVPAHHKLMESSSVTLMLKADKELLFVLIKALLQVKSRKIHDRK